MSECGLDAGDFVWETCKYFIFFYRHIQEDLKQLSISEDELSKMSDEEKNFYFFKLHDSDNNDHLDGLEILHAATHHSDGHVHKLDRESEHDSEENSVIGECSVCLTVLSLE